MHRVAKWLQLLGYRCRRDNRACKPEAIMSDAQFRVRVTKDHLVFSAAHFITFNGNICERLHGHNWAHRCRTDRAAR